MDGLQREANMNTILGGSDKERPILGASPKAGANPDRGAEAGAVAGGEGLLRHLVDQGKDPAGAPERYWPVTQGKA